MKLDGEKILVTGGAGFIGSHICERLIKENAKVVVLDDFSTGKLSNLESIKNNIKIIHGNIKNYNDVCKAIKDCSAVIHEAFPYGKSGMGLDEQFIDDGIIGTYNILKASVKNNIKKVINVSSVAVYGIQKTMPVDEENPANPFLPYGVTKLSGELYCSTFSNLYGLDTISLRYFYVYGPRYAKFDHSAMVNFLHNAVKSKPLTIYGDGSQIRDYTYIDDVVDGTILATIKNDTYGKVYNISAGKRITILELAEKIKKITNKNVEIKFAKKSEYRFSDKYCKIPIGLTKKLGDEWIDERSYIGDISKAKSDLGYSPKVTFDKGIKKTADWIETLSKRKR